MKEVDVMGFRVYFASEEPQGGGNELWETYIIIIIIIF